MSYFESIIEGVSDNLKTLIALGGLYAVGVETGHIGGYPDIPSLPDWWGLAALVVVAVAAVSYVAGNRLADLLPDPVGTYLIAMDADDAQGGGIYELNEPAWEELRVVRGELFEWSGSSVDVYECREFRREDLTAVANWKGTKTGSELSKPVEREEVMEQIRTLREEHEQQARYGEAIRSSLPALLRQLDKWRAKDLNSALEGHISPNLGDRSIDDMIQERLPDAVLPDYLQEDDVDADDEEPVALEILEGDDALEPLETPGPLANDGGEIDER